MSAAVAAAAATTAAANARNVLNNKCSPMSVRTKKRKEKKGSWRRREANIVASLANSVELAIFFLSFLRIYFLSFAQNET